jgi:hypothetical protein
MNKPPNPPPRFRWNWLEFAFAGLANATGTLVALMIAYMYGVAAGYIKANWRSLLLPVALLTLTLVVFIRTVYVMRSGGRWTGSISEPPERR